ncbi:hypothetical protein E4U43_001917 [Claviceps pusilla]|uniref:Uncharacterized protein n=1 Tax=Claviceps pusilla TaxID=123648 RepID=A0A9P7SYR9_9HYPO|nr:hypothetical protein E4U43_001917 [Claviceps pusilla]
MFIQNPKNDIDRQIDAKLVEIWDKHSMSWSEKERNNFREIAAAAQVTHATNYVSSHKIYRRMRGRTTTPAEYTVLAVIFGTIAVRRLDCMREFEKTHNPDFYAGIMTLDTVKKQKLKINREQTCRSRSNQAENKGQNEPKDGTKPADANEPFVIDTGERTAGTPTKTWVPTPDSSEPELDTVPSITIAAKSRESGAESQAAEMSVSRTGKQTGSVGKDNFLKVEDATAESQRVLENTLPQEIAHQDPQGGTWANKQNAHGNQRPRHLLSQSLSRKRPQIEDDIWGKLSISPRKKNLLQERIEALESRTNTQDEQIKTQNEQIKQQAEKLEKVARYVANYLAESPGH